MLVGEGIAKHSSKKAYSFPKRDCIWETNGGGKSMKVGVGFKPIPLFGDGHFAQDIVDQLARINTIGYGFVIQNDAMI